MLGLVLVLAFLVLAAVGPWIVPYPEDARGAVHLDRKLQPPGALHWFGTDEVGNDVYTRVILGARVSLQIGLIITLVAALLGVPLGVLAGYVALFPRRRVRVLLFQVRRRHRRCCGFSRHLRARWRSSKRSLGRQIRPCGSLGFGNHDDVRLRGPRPGRRDHHLKDAGQ